MTSQIIEGEGPPFICIRNDPAAFMGYRFSRSALPICRTVF